MVTIKRETIVSGRNFLKEENTDTEHGGGVISIRKTIVVRIGEIRGRSYSKANERLRGSASSINKSS